MANNVESNFREKVMPTFLTAFDTQRIYSKLVNTQFLDGVFNPESGTSVAFKRPSRYNTIETAKGDITGESASDIVVGNAFGRVQNQITVLLDYDVIDQALKLNNLAEIIAPAATELVTKLETNFADFMTKNTALLSGTVGTSVTAWKEVAESGALMKSTGVPQDSMWSFAMNPFTQVELAEQQRSLGAGGSAGTAVMSALDRATINENFAGMRVMAATNSSTYTADSVADRVGALSANPDVTYLTTKDTYTQALVVDNFGVDLEIKAGEQVQITGVNRLNLNNRKLVLDQLGNPIVWTATVVADVTLSGTGTGTIVVTGPAVFEAATGGAGAFNTASRAPISGDVVTILGAASDTHQPNLFWHKDAFSIGTVPLKKLEGQVNTGTTSDGIHIQVTRGSDFTKFSNQVRFDILPAFAVMNPFLAGQGFGNP